MLVTCGISELYIAKEILPVANLSSVLDKAANSDDLSRIVIASVS